MLTKINKMFKCIKTIYKHIRHKELLHVQTLYIYHKWENEDRLEGIC